MLLNPRGENVVMVGANDWLGKFVFWYLYLSIQCLVAKSTHEEKVSRKFRENAVGYH